jgi:hypothetical protein
VDEIEVLAGDTLIHHARLNRPRPEIAAKLNLPEEKALIGFSDQWICRESAITQVYYV